MPYGLLNGSYSTSIYAIFTKIISTPQYDGTLSYQYSASGSHILTERIAFADGSSSTYDTQEPIRVKTPVIAPFHTTDSNRMSDLTEEQKKTMNETQIKEYERKQSQAGTELVAESANAQLRLDENYELIFDPAQHQNWLSYGFSSEFEAWNNEHMIFSDGEVSDNKYDKYVLQNISDFHLLCISMTYYLMLIHGYVFMITTRPPEKEMAEILKR